MKKKLLAIGVLLLIAGFASITNNTSASTAEGTLSTGLQTGLEGVTKAAPTLSPAAGEYHATQTVTLTAAGATKICYTTNGTTEPSCASATTCTAGTALASGGTISITVTTTVKSAGCYADASTGPVATSAYTLTCAAIDHAATYNAYPTCGPATCDSGYTVSGLSCVSSGGTVITPGGGGGGGGGSSSCSAVTYSDWSTTCANNLQYRNVLTQTPVGCTLTTAQEADRQRACSVNYCSSVTYFDWVTTCVGNLQYRNISTQTPTGCTLTTAQEADKQRTCPTTGTSAGTGTTSNILEDIMNEAKMLDTDSRDNLFAYNIGHQLNSLSYTANTALEQSDLIKYKKILDLDKSISATERMTIAYFITYGTPSTYKIGAGQRAAVINSYYQAYGKLPNSEAEWSDVLKICNGRWPAERNAAAEARAKVEFKKVYARNAVMTNNIDENAIMVIAYGLLPTPRNMNSERVASITFKWVYGHNPVNALAWNIVR
ncbi:MAG: hypothetical protein WC306_04020, partial [Candidatus Paceibacterota bacterium]